MSTFAEILFFLDIAGGRILSVRTDGSDVRTVVTTNCKHPDGIAVDVEAGHLYWTNMGTPEADDGFILRADLDGTNITTVVQEALQQAPSAGMKAIKAHLPTIRVMENGWSVMRENAGVYGVDYLQRATITLAGLGCNKPVDAVYPLIVSDADSRAPSGDQQYVIHFDKDELPPAQAFWSLTMYDKDGFQVANPSNRYAIGDRDAIQYNADESLDIYIQAQSPGKAQESNWLPSSKEARLA